jgi:hypothetical protein
MRQTLQAYEAVLNSCHVDAKVGIFATLGKILGVAKCPADIKSASFANGTDTATVDGEPATLFCTSHVLQLLFNEC